MVAFGNQRRQQKGNGIMDTLLNKFTYQRYPGERHAISLAPSTFGKPMNFMGPGTRLDLRLNPDNTPKVNSLPLSKSDYASFRHDLAYDRAKKEYEKNPTSENRRQQLNKIWQADDKFVDEMKYDYEEPMAPIAGKLIQTKEFMEKTGVLPTKTFSGFGEESADPTFKLKQLVKEKYMADEKVDRRKKKIQKGGVLPLLPIGVAVASAIAGKLASDLYDFVKKKITGKGYAVPNHRTRNQKKQFLLDVIKQI